jgi:heme exporter protein B
VAIAGAESTSPLFSGNQAPHELGKWVGLLGLYDMVFLLVAIAVFDFLLED